MIELLRRLRQKLIGIGHTGDFCRSLHFRKCIQDLTIHRALDAGCGDGWYSLYLASKKGARIDAYDLDPDRVSDLKKQAAKQNLPITTNVANLVTFSPAGEYDLVVCVDVMEHIPEYRAALNTLCSSLKPGGHIFLHTPRDIHRSYVGVEVDNPLHVREGFSAEQFTQDLAENGCRVTRAVHTFGPLASTVWELELRLGRGNLFARSFLSIVFPIFKLLIWIDSLRSHPAGNGLCVFAIKESA
ncbi:MAG: class I SAM-dependent methyltransferase [bacterium]|nr:class I SAM-dependent methyltransferase [bacterium]